jgi:hypothetical protein
MFLKNGVFKRMSLLFLQTEFCRKYSFCQNFVFRVSKEGFGLFTPTRLLCKTDFYFYIILNIKKKNMSLRSIEGEVILLDKLY